MSNIVLGILETGLVEKEYRNQYGSYPEMFRSLFEALASVEGDSPIQYKDYNVIEGEYPEDIDECDAYLITGSKHDSFSDDPWIVTLRDYIRTLHQKQKKMVGICFGHQVIAHALGGKAGRCDKGWGVGVYSAQVTDSEPPAWLNNSKSFNLNVTHQDQVSSIPPDATLLAGNEFCPYSAFYIEDIALCFQGHPEFSKDYTKVLMNARQDIIGEPTFSKGMSSFEQATDHLLVAKCMLDFIR